MREASRLASAAGLEGGRRFASDVQYYLSLLPRQLPSRYFYDPLGSALFEAICHLPWYRVTRSEIALLARHARGIFAASGPVGRVIELGSGSGEKLAALVNRGAPDQGAFDAHLIDLSESALAAAERMLASLDVLTFTHRASYEDGLRAVPPHVGRALVLFLGSNIGNFDPPAADALLRTIRGALAAGDTLLLGADLVKPERDLLLAYDDPLGVTAAFDRNILARINRELDGDFALDRFAHQAVWNREASRVEMHLVSLARQRVLVRGAGVDVTLAKGERIWTESSYKFEPVDLVERVEATGFARVDQWIDHDAAFALTLFRAIG